MMKGDVEKEQAWVKGLFPLWFNKNGALDGNSKKKFVSGPHYFVSYPFYQPKNYIFLEQKLGAVLKVLYLSFVN